MNKFCFPGPSYDQGEGKNLRKKTITNCSSNIRQTNAHIFRLLVSTDMKQICLNVSCFGDHDGTKGVSVRTFLHCITST